MTNFYSANDKTFILKALQAEQRFDGRNYLQRRKIRVFFGLDPGNVQVYFGDTHVISKTYCEIVEPRAEKPSEGFLKFRVDTSIIAEQQDKSNLDSKNYADEISKLIERIIRESNALDTESLCLISGKRVWSIQVESTLVNDDGNLIDAFYLSTIISLLHFRKPYVQVEVGENIRVFSQTEKAYQPLSIHHIPIAFTFALFCDSNVIVADAQRIEEEIMDGRVTITINIYQDICSIHKPGGAPLDPNLLSLLIQTCSKQVAQMTTFIRNILKQCDQNSILKTLEENRIVIMDFDSAQSQANVDDNQATIDLQELKNVLDQRVAEQK